jgi:hypothetical protein
VQHAKLKIAAALSDKYDLEATRIVGAFMMGAAEALKDDVTSGLKTMEPMFEGTSCLGFDPSSADYRQATSESQRQTCAVQRLRAYFLPLE